MKFSLVITTHNRVELLKRAIASALEQTLPGEIIVVDNASSDATSEYVKRLGDRVVYHRQSTNTRHAGAVNAGVDIATGDWIKFIDDDDYLAPTCLAEMAAAIAQHPDAVICSCQAAQVTLGGDELSCTPQTGPGQAFFVPQAAIHYGMLLEQVPFGTPIQVAVKRAAFLKAGGWDVSLTNSVEVDAWIRIAEQGDGLFINRCLAYRTVWPGGHDQKIDLPYRRAMNAMIKTRIYQRIHPQYRAQVPPLAQIHRYVDLHWGLVALKQRQLRTALSLALPAALSPQAWKLLNQARTARNPSSEASQIPKIELPQQESFLP